jgi:hypothetical protein
MIWIVPSIGQGGGARGPAITLSGHGSVHSERLVHKLDAFTDENRAAQATVRELIWNFDRDLKAYRLARTKQRKAALRASSRVSTLARCAVSSLWRK